MGVNTFLLKGGGLTIADMQSAGDNSESKGFHEKDKEVPLEYVIPTKLMLAVSELAESLDLAGILGIDLRAAVIEKMNYNEGRPYMHGGKTI